MRLQVWHACPRLSARKRGVRMQVLTRGQTLGSALLGPHSESRVWISVKPTARTIRGFWLPGTMGKV